MPLLHPRPHGFYCGCYYESCELCTVMTNMTTPKDPSNYDSVPTVDTEVTIVNEEPELNTRRQWKLFAILNLVGWPLNFFMAFTV